MERAIDNGAECAAILQQATACRGALDGLIVEVVEGHIREHVTWTLKARARRFSRTKPPRSWWAIAHSFLK